MTKETRDCLLLSTSTFEGYGRATFAASLHDFLLDRSKFQELISCTLWAIHAVKSATNEA